MRLNWLDWNEKSLLVNWMVLNGVCTASFQLITLTRLVAIGNNFNSCTRNIQQVLIKPNYIRQSALSSSSAFQYLRSIKIENKSTPKCNTRHESLALGGVCERLGEWARNRILHLANNMNQCAPPNEKQRDKWTVISINCGHEVNRLENYANDFWTICL